MDVPPALSVVKLSVRRGNSKSTSNSSPMRLHFKKPQSPGRVGLGYSEKRESVDDTGRRPLPDTETAPLPVKFMEVTVNPETG